MQTLSVTFPSPHGHSLSGALELPAQGARRFGIFAHCFTCSKASRAAAYVSRALTAQGIGMLRFDFTGLGRSGGQFGDLALSSDIADLRAAAAYLQTEHGPVALLVGHSLGGAAVLRAAHDIDSVRAVATIGAPANPSHVRKLFGAQAKLNADAQATISVGGRDFSIRGSFVQDLERYNIADIAELRRPLLVLHAPHDNVVGIDNAAQIFQAAKHPKSFISLDSADHLLTNPDDARYAAHVIAAWATRYLGDPS